MAIIGRTSLEESIDTYTTQNYASLLSFTFSTDMGINDDQPAQLDWRFQLACF
jgi:hypothetical protein